MPVWMDMDTTRCKSLSLHKALLSWLLSLSAPVCIFLSSCMQAFPALAQVQALRRVNECLLAENRAMLRVLARLSETASMPETEDLWSSEIICPHFRPVLPLSQSHNLHFSFLLEPVPSFSAVFLSGRSCTLLMLASFGTEIHPSLHAFFTQYPLCLSEGSSAAPITHLINLPLKCI